MDSILRNKLNKIVQLLLAGSVISIVTILERYLVLNMQINNNQPWSNWECMFDIFEGYTSWVNLYLEDKQQMTGILITVSSLIYDIGLPLTLIIWGIYDGRGELPFGCIALHIFRYLLLNLHHTASPPQLLWVPSPYLPSITVNYLTSTSFFDPHIAILSYLLIYLISKKILFLFLFIPLILYQIILMLILRRNYSIDGIYALITAHYCFLLMRNLIPYLQLKYSFSRIGFIPRFAIIILVLCIHLYFTQYYMQGPSPDCIRDIGFELTEVINEILKKDKEVARIFLIIVSGLIDASLIIFVFVSRYSFYVFEYIIAYALMFTVRGFTLPLLVFPHPPSKIWFETGFPHICPFDPTSDYFFSGHILLTGLQSIASYNFGAWKRKLSIFYFWPVTIVLFCMLLIVRVHYTIDMIYGLLMIHYGILLLRLVKDKIYTLFDSLSLKLSAFYLAYFSSIKF